MGELHRLPSRNPRGEIQVEPCEEDGGSWLVLHVSRGGAIFARIGTHFALDDALRAAREAAERLGADYFDVVTL